MEPVARFMRLPDGRVGLYVVLDDITNDRQYVAELAIKRELHNWQFMPEDALYMVPPEDMADVQNVMGWLLRQGIQPAMYKPMLDGMPI